MQHCPTSFESNSQSCAALTPSVHLSLSVSLCLSLSRSLFSLFFHLSFTLSSHQKKRYFLLLLLVVKNNSTLLFPLMIKNYVYLSVWLSILPLDLQKRGIKVLFTQLIKFFDAVLPLQCIAILRSSCIFIVISCIFIIVIHFEREREKERKREKEKERERKSEREKESERIKG